MKYISTRDQNQTVTPSQAIVAGISPDGGLYLPESIAQISPDVQKSMPDFLPAYFYRLLLVL